MFKGLRERLSGIGEPPPGPNSSSSDRFRFDAQPCNRASRRIDSATRNIVFDARSRGYAGNHVAATDGHSVSGRAGGGHPHSKGPAR